MVSDLDLGWFAVRPTCSSGCRATCCAPPLPPCLSQPEAHLGCIARVYQHQEP